MEEYGITNEGILCVKQDEKEHTKFELRKSKEDFGDKERLIMTAKDDGNSVKIGKNSYNYSQLSEFYALLKVIFEREDKSMAGDVEVYKKL